jgi:hypothetical protein
VRGICTKVVDAGYKKEVCGKRERNDAAEKGMDIFVQTDITGE